MPIPAVLTEGTTFAAYEVQRRLAVGGMGEVYLCRHRVLDRLDAVKVLRPHLALDAGLRRRFLREGLSAARLRHPNVVTVYTADEADGLLYLAMEYVAADDLATLLARAGALTPERVVRLVGVVAGALDAAHAAHLVHRDIKPSNLLVTGAGTTAESVVLVDFGISRRLDMDSDLTRTGEVVGTLAYCSPEQLSRGPIGPAVDQYALACVAYECLAGQVPYPREGQLAVIAAHLTAPPPRLRAVRPGLPEAADDVLGRAMAKDPTQRYPSCLSFVAALSAALSVRQPSPCPPGDHDDATAMLDDPDFPGPAGLAAMAAMTDVAGMIDAAGVPGTAEVAGSAGLVVRVGRRRGAAEPVVISLDKAAVAVRAEPPAVAGCVRWWVAQLAVRYRDRDLCLVAALQPHPDERWLWLHWLPHARPANPPVPGPHVATTADAAADLLARLGALVQLRRSDEPTGPRAGSRVLAVLDGRLGIRVDEPVLASAGRYGVHVLHLVDPGTRVPVTMATLDIDAAVATYRWVIADGGVPVEGVPDTVPASYVRSLIDQLPY